jgi:universal stress protein E
MDRLRTLLVVIDPEAPRSPAFAKAWRLARAFNARVELLICDVTPSLAPELYATAEPLTAVLEPVRAQHQVCLDSLAAPLKSEGLAVTTCVEFGRPLHTALEARIRAVTPDLVIKDTHHHSLVRRTVITNTDWHLIRDCPVPLLLAKPHTWPDVLRVVAAVDAGHAGDRSDFLTHAIIDASVRLARGFGALPDLVHAWSPAPLLAQMTAIGAPAWPAVSVPPELIGDLDQFDADRLAHLARVHDVESGRVHRIEGVAGDVLPEFAEREQVDMLVMGAVSRSALERLFVGNTAERLLERIPCDVLIVKLPHTAATTTWAATGSRSSALSV